MTHSITDLATPLAVPHGSLQYLYQAELSTRIDPREICTARELTLAADRPPNKFATWVAGRTAAKAAVRHYHHDHQRDLSWHDIEILYTQSGAPCYITHLSDPLPTLQLSLSHCAPLSVAALDPNPDSQGFGLDIERLRTFKTETAQQFMTPVEYRRYQALSFNTQAQYATTVWTVKEAYLKALTVGLRIHPRILSVTLDNPSEPLVETEDPRLPTPASVYYTLHPRDHVIACVTL